MNICKVHNIVVCIAILIAVCGCVEPFEANTEGFLGLLVIDAKLTDEVKHHVVLLSRARPFETDSIVPEPNASVKVVDDMGVEFDFEEKNTGTYVSINVFNAEPNHSYQLVVALEDGSSFISESVLTPKESEIGQLYAEHDIQDNAEEGVAILLNNNHNDVVSKYYRYEYEEAFKIVAPYYSPFEFNVKRFASLEEIDVDLNEGIVYAPIRGNGITDLFFITITARTKNVSICYTSRKSKNLVLGNSDIGIGNLSSRFLIRFLDRDDYAISHRYSVLVKQLVLNRDAHAYYNDLNKFTSSEDVFTQIQPGFIEGNIVGLKDPNQKVLGYFEVASVSEKRLFFNHNDFFVNETSPIYAINCEPTGSPPLNLRSGHFSDASDNDDFIVDGTSVDSPLIDGILAETLVYYAHNVDYQAQVEALNESMMNSDGLAPFFTKDVACGDCTVLGSLEKPDFWIE